ncbi:hypothetical protein [Longimicrobium sp.]|uniref:hypothetical protein n=1 Tax=Longimicrobium sp. TaxID=2029185 RepID=UPI002E37744B|nr:hypothetical protein [Longimicrobium sp.]HEX6039138.1 hypothetical protein [Longimicrobium sp.]
MQVIRRISMAAVAVAVFAGPAAAQELPAARTVLDRYAEAIGGRERAQGFQSRRLVYTVDGGGATINVEAVQRRPNQQIAIMATPMGEIRSGFDGTTAWAVTPGGPMILQGPQADEVRARANFDSDVLFDDYASVETTERAEYGGKACWKVRMTTTAGSTSSRCFDVETGLMAGMEAEQNGVPVTVVYNEYREFDGLKYPSRFTSSAMGQEVVTTLVSVSHADIPVSEFALPDAVKALQP